MLIISLNMHDTKMPQAKMNSTGKITLETTEKSLVVTIIKLLDVLPCLKYIQSTEEALPLCETLSAARGQ